MFLFLLILIKPHKGEFRTKIDNLASEIKAYSLLERKACNINTHDITVKSNHIFFIPPPENNISYISDEKTETSLLKAIKNDETIFWNNGKLEIVNNRKLKHS